MVAQASYEPLFPDAQFCIFGIPDTTIIFLGVSITAAVPTARVGTMVY